MYDGDVGTFVVNVVSEAEENPCPSFDVFTLGKRPGVKSIFSTSIGEGKGSLVFHYDTPIAR